MIKLCGGKWRGKKLFFSKSDTLRPTQNRIREAVCNIIQSNFLNATVLDACCGTGAYGLEALSRGASHVTFVDRQPKWVYQNRRFLNCEAESTVVSQSILSFLKQCDESYDIIFLDPPYPLLDLTHAALKAIFDFDILRLSGVIIVEYERKRDLKQLSTWPKPRLYHYSDTTIGCYRT